MRDQVLNAASALFMEFGYEPVSINMIAERAGVTKASVYYYFVNKSALFAASLSAMLKRIRDRTSMLLERHLDLRTQLEQVAIMKLARTHVDFESLMREAAPFLTQEQQDEIRAAENGIHEVMAETFTRAMDDGQIARGDPMLLSHAFAALLMIGNREQRAGGRELAAAIVGLFWNGVGPR